MPVHCGKEWPDDAAFCRICGQTLGGDAPEEATATPAAPATVTATLEPAPAGTQGARRCPRCSAVEHGDARLCRECGKTLPLPAHLAQARAEGGPACAKCGGMMSAGDLFCGSCGARVESAHAATPAYCPDCGSPATPGAGFCASCGIALSGASLRPQYAGYWKRFGARLIDLIITAAFAAIPGIIVGVIVYQAVLPDGPFVTNQQQENAAAAAVWAGFGIYIAISVAYFVIGWSSRRTWGMRAVGVNIERASDGEPPSFLAAFGRCIVLLLVFLLSPLFLLDSLWMLWDKRKQTWHDKAAGTIVVESG